MTVFPSAREGAALGSIPSGDVTNIQATRDIPFGDFAVMYL